MRLIPLTQGQFAIVDDDDFETLSQWKWQAYWHERTQSFYATRRLSVKMHRQIMNCTPEEQIDHINHNTLDNRRGNLRKCTATQNSINRRKRIGYKGVSSVRNKWRATIGSVRKNERRHLGYFPTAEEAARAYDSAATEMYGEFALLNFSL